MRRPETPTVYGLTPDARAITQAVELAVYGSAQKNDRALEDVAARFNIEITKALDNFFLKPRTDGKTGHNQKKLTFIFTPSPDIPVTLQMTPSPDIRVDWMSVPEEDTLSPTPPFELVQILTEQDFIETPSTEGTPIDLDPTPTTNWNQTPELTDSEKQSYSQLIATTDRRPIAFGAMPVRLDPDHEMAKEQMKPEARKILIAISDKKLAPELTIDDLILDINFDDL